jgi:hypothetical protein
MGDRVYGYNEDQKTTITTLAPYLGVGNLIIDDVNNHYRSNEEKLPGFSLADKAIWNALPNNEQQKLIDSYVQCYLAMPKLASLPRYNIGEAPLVVPNEEGLESEEEVKMISGACKAGILKTVLDGNTVHFNVDQYTKNPEFINQPPEKLDKKTGGEIQGFYTAKELRYAKRLVDFYPELASNIKFYERGKQVEAPWVSKSQEWGAYSPKSKVNIENTMKALSSSTTVSNTIQTSAKRILTNAKEAAHVVSELMESNLENSNSPLKP